MAHEQLRTPDVGWMPGPAPAKPSLPISQHLQIALKLFIPFYPFPLNCYQKNCFISSTVLQREMENTKLKDLQPLPDEQ